MRPLEAPYGHDSVRGEIRASLQMATDSRDLASTLSDRILRRLGYTMMTCTEALSVVACWEEARRMLEELGDEFTPKVGHRLSPPLADSVAAALERRATVVMPSRRAAKALCVAAASFDDFVPSMIAVWLRWHATWDTDRLEALRSRAGLSARDVRILSHLQQGRTNREIGQACGWSETTTKSYVYEVCKKLAVHTRAQAVALIALEREARAK